MQMPNRPQHIQVLSDLHLEFYQDHGKALLEHGLAWNPEATAVVLAGDIGVMGRLRGSLEAALGYAASRFDQVFFVPGNHEFYGCHAPDTVGKLRSLAASIARVTLLEPGVVGRWGDRRVVGATLWFRDGSRNKELAEGMSDFRAIRHFERWVYKQNKEHVAWLEEVVQEGDIVVTHHLPAWPSVAPRYAGDPFNAFFLCDMESLIEERKPLWWIHGHTHEPCDYRLGATRVVANPRGYPDEARPSYMPVTLSDGVDASSSSGLKEG